MIYENGIPKTLLTEAGFVSLNDNKYHYYLQDHQGNNRVVADQTGAVEEVNHYYPLVVSLLQLHPFNPTNTTGKNWIEKADWIGMIMERECMMRHWEDGMRWIRWRINIMALVRIIIALIIHSDSLTLMVCGRVIRYYNLLVDTNMEVMRH